MYWEKVPQNIVERVNRDIYVVDKMSHQQLEAAVREVPDHLMTMIMHYVTGFHNISAKEISEPIVRHSMVNISIDVVFIHYHILLQVKQSLRQFYIVFIIQYAILVVGGVVANVYVIYYIIRYKLYVTGGHSFDVIIEYELNL